MSSLKNRTLKNRYESRLNRETVLVEAVDVKKIEAATQALQKLESMIPPEAAMFQKAMKDAQVDLQKAMSGGFIQGVKNIFGSDPLAKTSAMINALQIGFAALPKILGMYLPKEMRNEGQKATFDLIPADKQEVFYKTLVNAFKPNATGSAAGDIKSLFSNNVMPYVSNLDAALKELMMNVAPNGAFKLGQEAAAQPPEQIQQMTAPQQGQPTGTQATPGTTNAPTTSSQPSQASNATTNTTATEPTKATQAPTPQKKLNPKTDADRIANISYFLASQTGIDKAAAQKLIAKLAELNGLTDIPTPQKPSNKPAAPPLPPAGSAGT